MAVRLRETPVKRASGKNKSRRVFGQGRPEENRYNVREFSISPRYEQTRQNGFRTE